MHPLLSGDPSANAMPCLSHNPPIHGMAIARLHKCTTDPFSSYVPSLLLSWIRWRTNHSILIVGHRSFRLLHELCHAAAWVIDGVKRPPHGEAFKRWGDVATAATGLPVTRCHTYDIVYRHNWCCIGQPGVSAVSNSNPLPSDSTNNQPAIQSIDHSTDPPTYLIHSCINPSASISVTMGACSLCLTTFLPSFLPSRMIY